MGGGLPVAYKPEPSRRIIKNFTLKKSRRLEGVWDTGGGQKVVAGESGLRVSVCISRQNRFIITQERKERGERGEEGVIITAVARS